jgi:hypothetical protein
LSKEAAAYLRFVLKLEAKFIIWERYFFHFRTKAGIHIIKITHERMSLFSKTNSSNYMTFKALTIIDSF